MKRVLIISANTRAAITELRSLVKIKDIEIHIAVKENKLSEKLRYGTYITPANYHTYKSIDNIINFLKELSGKAGPFILFPNGEEILRKIISSKELLNTLGITLPMPDKKTYELFSDKFSFSEICNRFGLDTPHKIDVDLSKFKEKFVIKSKQLSDESNVLPFPMLIENQKAFKKLKKMSIDLSKHFSQRYIEGQSYYYCASYLKGNKRACFIQENLHQQPNGKSIIKAIPGSLPDDIIAIIDKMMGHYKWDGVMMLELKECMTTKRLYAIECNPRFWGPLQLAADNNVDFVKSLVDREYSCLSAQENKYGYIWLGGYFHGLFLKFLTGSSFQFFKENRAGIRYKDVWFRNDTYKYFFIEPFIILLREIRNIL